MQLNSEISRLQPHLPTEAEKKALGIEVGNDLYKHYGKKKFYSQREIKNAMKRIAENIDWACWAYSLYMDHISFDVYHRTIGEDCDYLSMKSSMITSMTDHGSDSWFDFDLDLSWLDWPDFDIASIFDFIDF